MKLHVRLLLTIPFAIVTLGYYHIANPDLVCNGLLSTILFIPIYCILLLTVILAFYATFRKKQLNEKIPEPISLSISLITVLVLIYSLTLRGHRNGEEWIRAESQSVNDEFESQGLTLRKNGNFTFYPNSECAFSGEYKKNGDTILLDKEMIAPELSAAYLLNSTTLTPLVDTLNSITFTISDAK